MNNKRFTPFRDGNSKQGLTLNKAVRAKEKTRAFSSNYRDVKRDFLPACPNKVAGRSLTGFTIVELMVAIIILTIFLLSVGMILTSSVRFWNSGWDQVGVQQDASYAFARIEKIVRSGSSATVLGGGSGLSVTVDDTIYVFQLSGDALQLVVGGNTEEIADNVQSVSFAVNVDTVSVSLALINGTAQTNFRTTVLLRNFE